MDKQEMVRCPLICSVFTGCKHRGEHSRMTGCDGGDGCPACVPVEPTQPKLPRELPLVEDPNPDPYDYEGINSAWDSGAEYQREADQSIYQLALKRIEELGDTLRLAEKTMIQIDREKVGIADKLAELEAEKAELRVKIVHMEATGELNQQLNSKLQAQVASLKEQLAETQKFDLRQYIPEGKYCDGCRFDDNYCVVCGKNSKALSTAVHTASGYKSLKRRRCPVPAKEEAV